MPSKITVIGGSGFIGTYFCEQLANNHIPFEIIDLRSSQRFPEKSKFGDIRDIESLRQTITGDVIVHLAALHSDNVRDPQDYQRTNVDGTANIAQVCAEKNIRKIIFTSTVAVYGFAEADADETAPINPFNNYGHTKFAAEEILRSWQEKGNRALIILRPTAVFGEGNRGNVYNLFKQIALGRFVMIGKGHNQKSIAYIGNFVAFLYQCLATKQDYALYNYVDTPNLDMNTLVRQVNYQLFGQEGGELRLPYWLGMVLGYLADFWSKLSRRKLLISSIRIKKFCSTSTFATSKSELDGFVQPYELEDGIKRTIHQEFINPDPKRQIFYTE